VVLNADFQIVNTLTRPEDLAAFARLFRTKLVAAPAGALSWSHKLDVRNERSSARWLYDPRGFLQVLTKAKVPIYKVPEAEKFRALLLEAVHVAS
jgi:hypothetical protein